MSSAVGAQSDPGSVRVNVRSLNVSRSIRSRQSKSALRRAVQLARKHWFILGVFFSIALARAAPWVGVAGGPLRPEITVKRIGVGLIFIMSGLALKTEELAAAAKHVRLHAIVQGFSLLATPAIVCVVTSALGGSFSGVDAASSPSSVVEALLMGIKCLSCIPPPVSTGLILTKAVDGNEAAALFNGTLGAFMGVLWTPILIMHMTGGSAHVPVASTMRKLCVTVVMPLLAGQAIKKMNLVSRTTLRKLPFSTARSVILLTIIYTTFCSTFSRELDVSSWVLGGLFVCLLLMQLGNMCAVRWIADAAGGFTRRDTVAIVFCSVHKSLTMGMPIIGIVFDGNPDLGLITMPLLVYHPMQILLGSLMVPALTRWVKAGGGNDRGAKLIV